MNKSYNGIFRGCVGAIDGFFLPTQCPTKKEVYGDQVAYYSGHYKSHGINIQTVCDSKLRFIYFGVVGKGSTNDAYAYVSTQIDKVLCQFPAGKMYFVGDAAYPLSEQLITPYTGIHRHNQAKDSYNFYHSQLRIRIEMAFGYLTSKWSILHTKRKGSMNNHSRKAIACAFLQNYIINNDIPIAMDTEDYFEMHGNSFRPLEGSNSALGYLPSHPNDMTVSSVPGQSMTREAILRHISQSDYRRPPHNITRNRNTT